MSEWLNTIEASPIGWFFVFLMGLIWGSFFNVVILRIPEEKSLIPRSHCPKCETPIPWYHNVPVLSYLWLKGRCHKCKVRISPQYPLVELATALIYLGLYSRYGLQITFFAYAVFLSLLLIISVIDLYHQIIPDEFSLPGIVIGFLFQFASHTITWKESLLGILLGGGIFLAIAMAYEKLTKREGLGGGDVKLLAMIGAWLGVSSLLPVIIISSALGSVVGVALMIIQKRDSKSAIPFGPFLAAGAVAYVIWGKTILAVMFPSLP